MEIPPLMAGESSSWSQRLNAALAVALTPIADDEAVCIRGPDPTHTLHADN